MTKTKLLWRRSLCMIFCVILIFSALPCIAYADTAVITSGTMYSYFQTYNTSGTWVDLQTPAHWITATGEVAYCLQTSKDNPYNGGYYSIDGEEVYDDYVLTGLRAILTHGYPADSGGFDDQAARYATANAIRFWLAENHCDGVPQYLNLTVNGDWIRGKYGCEDLFDWCIGLVNLARTQTVVISDASLTFNPSEINLTQNGQYFSGSAYLNKGISGDYSLMDNSPDGSLIISGHTGVQSETLNLSIPIQHANQEFMLCAYGFDETPTARLFFWAPAAANQQRIVTYVLDQNENTFVRGFLTIRTPGSVVQPKKGSLQILKTDPEGNPLSGVGFTLYDSSKTELDTQTTGSTGVVTFADLPLGNYYYAETSALPGYVQDSTLYPVSITSDGQVVQKTMTNTPEKGGLQILKTDEDGNPLSGVGITLYDSSKRSLSTKTTDSSGVVSFPDLPLGNYYYAETSALPGYVPDTTLYPVTISSSSQTVQKTLTNSLGKGSLKLIKTDENGTPIASTGFCLYDSEGNRLKSGGTDSSGVLIFNDLPLGDYYYQESFAVPGYALDDTMYPVSITENGQIVEKSVVNYKSAGTVKILKTDSETGAPLQGAEFTLYNEHMAEVIKGTTDENGLVVFAGLPLGPYYCQETNAPPGYFPEGSIEQFYLDANGKVVTLSYTNAPARGSIKIIKKNDDGEYLSGVEFTLYDADKQAIKTGTTDENGVLVFDGLPIGDYWYAETSELPGYIPNHNLMAARVGYHTAVDEHTVTNYKAHGHVRVIKSNENGSPLAGVHFKLFNEAGSFIDEGDTDAEGKLVFSMLPIGKYFVQETSTLDGYVLDDTPIPIELTRDGEVITKNITNSAAIGSVRVIKTDAETGAPLSGVHFILTDSNDTSVGGGTTDETGVVVFSHLPLGTYTLTETETRNGYILDATPREVTISTNGQTVEVSISNTPARGSVAIVKTDSETGAALAGVHFKLLDEAGALVAEGDTGSDGTLTLPNIPVGYYILRETATISGYLLDESPISVEIRENGQVVQINATNTMARGGVTVTKTDSETGAALKGVHFKLFDATNGLAAEGDTDENGKLVLNGLPLGSYTLKETAAIDGYAVDETPIPVEITENGQMLEISVKNTPFSGSLEIMKKAAHEDIMLMGAGYRLYDNSGEQIKEGYTDASGKLTFNDLPSGTYKYQEFKAPKGFELDETEYTFSVTAQELHVKHTREDVRRTGTLQVTKKDTDGSLLSGAAFLLEFSTDGGKTWKPVVSRAADSEVSRGGCTTEGLVNGQLMTGENGRVRFEGLRADGLILYRLTETKAPEGHSLIGGTLYSGTLPIESENIYANDAEVFDNKAFVYSVFVTAVDDSLYRLPDSGGLGFSYLPFVMLCMAALFTIIFTKRKEH